MTAKYQWHDVYKAAVLETDWSKMEERILAAEFAIREREKAFPVDHGGTPEERQAIVDAMRSLTVLRADAASWSGRNPEPEKTGS
jgi:hypothetical protein